ncbi:MAG: nuclear transport factor 2 family protein [Flavobacteriales bacterium]|nr:nuclear transport factor 2 family protein [Flavobacteriales bacterium]
MEDAYAVATVAKDADGVMAYYAEDVVSYSKEKEPAKGKAAMRQYIADGMAKDSLGIQPAFTVLELFGNDDEHLTEIGSWVNRILPEQKWITEPTSASSKRTATSGSVSATSA